MNDDDDDLGLAALALHISDLVQSVDSESKATLGDLLHALAVALLHERDEMMIE